MALYESALDGALPFDDKMWTAKEITEHVRNGFRLAKPAKLSQHMYDLCLSCWATDPSTRPTLLTVMGEVKTGADLACDQEQWNLQRQSTKRRTNAAAAQAVRASISTPV